MMSPLRQRTAPHTLPPRTVRFTPGTQARRRVWYGGSLLFLCILFWSGSRHLAELSALQLHGETISATITALRTEPRAGHGRFRVTYAFNASGARLRREVSVSETRFRTFRPGGRVRVTYLPENPTVSRLGAIDAELVRQQRADLCAGMMVAGALLGCLLAAAEWDLRRQFWLATWGAVSRAEVTRLAGDPGARVWRVRYRFPLPGGRLGAGGALVPRRAVEGAGRGALIPVLYDPRRPKASAPVAALTAVQIIDSIELS